MPTPIMKMIPRLRPLTLRANFARVSTIRPSTHPFLHQYGLRPPLVQLHRPFASSFGGRVFADFTPDNFRRNRTLILIIAALLSGGIGATAYYIYLFHELVDKPLQAYPAPVAQLVKSALYYASRNDLAKMSSSFKAAVAEAERLGLHPLSDEVAGLKMECAGLLARLDDGKQKERAVEILEKVLDEAAMGAGYFQKEDRWEDRAKVLKRAVLLGYKVGEMYAEMGKEKEAEEAMVWSTETMLREVHRRAALRGNGSGKGENEGRESEDVKKLTAGEWFAHGEVAQGLEKLADLYEKSSQHVLAAPLYLRAVTLLPSADCHTLTLMNNLAASLCQQNPPEGAGITRKHLIADARKWVEKALEIDSTMKPPERTAECDEACVVATVNLAEIEEMLGKTDEALKRFVEAESLAKGIGMQEGIKKATEGIARVRKAVKVPDKAAK